MLLIVEGADLVGKSTLIERVRQTHPWPVAKVRWKGLPDQQAVTTGIALATIELLRVTAPTDLILDRCFFSMWAYGEDPGYLPPLIARFSAASAVQPTVLALLTASADEIERRYTREPNHFHSLAEIQRANARYPSLVTLLPPDLTVIPIDTSETSPDAAVEQIRARLPPSVD